MRVILSILLLGVTDNNPAFLIRYHLKEKNINRGRLISRKLSPLKCISWVPGGCKGSDRKLDRPAHFEKITSDASNVGDQYK